MAAVIGRRPVLMHRPVVVLRGGQVILVTVLTCEAGQVRGGVTSGFVMDRRITACPDRGFQRGGRNRPHEKGGDQSDQARMTQSAHRINLPAADARNKRQ